MNENTNAPKSSDSDLPLDDCGDSQSQNNAVMPDAHKSNNKQKVRRTMIGGQALLEGVMMRGKSSMAMAVRAPDGQIEIKSERIPPRGFWGKVPILRGVIAFVSSLSLGFKTLYASAEVSTPDEEMPSKGATTIAMIIGVIIAVALFIVIPSLCSSAIEKWGGYNNLGVLGLIEGVIRLVIFLAYLLAVRAMNDIKRTFMYHGAEHRTINCYEKGLELNVKNVQSCSVKHNRCGTTFLFFVIILAILVFALTNYLLSFFNNPILSNVGIKLLIRLALLPVIAGLSFELLRFLAALPDNKFTNAIRAPGLLLQKLTTALPDDEIAEVAIAAFNTVLAMDSDSSVEPIDFYERDFALEREKLSAYLAPNEQDADWIYCFVLDKSRSQLSLIKRVSANQCRKAQDLADRLKAGEPLSYVLGTSEFCGYTLKCDDRALIPRFETEQLALFAVDAIGSKPLRVLDLCTGSGCIAYTVAKRTQAEIVAADISQDALDLANENLKGLGVTVVKSDMFENIDGNFDVIVSNPPYVKTFEINTLSSEVKCQPRCALDGGEDGLHFYKIIANNLDRLNDGGTLLVEVGEGQAHDVADLFALKCNSVRIEKDLDQKERYVICEK